MLIDIIVREGVILYIMLRDITSVFKYILSSICETIYDYI